MHGIMGSEHRYQPAWEGRKTNNRVGIYVSGSEIDRSEIVSPRAHTHTRRLPSLLRLHAALQWIHVRGVREGPPTSFGDGGMAGTQVCKGQGTVQANRHTGRHTGRQAHRR
jgi:hypothetical protein